ncbi:MAG: outer membrane lipoprotein-sorting protein [Spirochaetota bacterium]|nr:outer membrane lipoprotein-sorting protein [Spirochaetota bacterium]
MHTKLRIVALTLIILMSTAGLLLAAPSGQEVMENVYNRPSGEDMTADLVMTLTNSRGSTRERSITQFSLDTGEMDKKMMFFLAPADVKDTSFMSWSYDDARDDDQWIYLPALRRVKRISSDSKNDRFMGSDFTYDDLGERHPEEDRHTILREENYKGESCYVVESLPIGDDDAFSKTVSWIVKDKWIGLKREYYDDKGKIYKTLNIEDYKQIDGYWVITNMLMSDLDRDQSTRIEMENVKFDTGLSDSFFSERQMQRGPRR